MHFELPEKVAGSLKEFASHYLMIVVSILTALALEQVVVTMHHSQAAHKASADIRAELKRNWDDTSEVLEADKKSLAAAQDLLAKLVERIRKDDKPGPEEMRALGMDATRISVNVAAIHMTAWNTAIANQALVYMDAEELKTYSDAYTRMQNLQQLSPRYSLDELLREMALTALAVKTDKADLQMLARTVTQYVMIMKIIDNQVQQQQDLLKPFSTSQVH
jgi:hypothetical protein